MTDWNQRLIGQLDFYWEAHLWPRLAGLTDDEYFWEPAADCWSVRRDATGGWQIDGVAPTGAADGAADGAAQAAVDGATGQPSTVAEPLTTIAWRMTHISVEIFESRYLAFFAGEGPTMFSPGERILGSGELPGTAADALAYLERAYRRWRDAVAGLGDAGLAEPLGPKGVDFAEFPMAELVLHLNREAMHHGAEICLLRDLFRARAAGDR